jgi:hypothetical protein
MGRVTADGPRIRFDEIIDALKQLDGDAKMTDYHRRQWLADLVSNRGRDCAPVTAAIVGQT